ncbi:hypothetical protein G9A89_018346 [Geosiphon pyriformis]|nr:hypothetical protein G9A89_018346 [Geosiphon pyriformis]
MDLDWCLTCSQHTSGTLYCSEVCRLQDMGGHPTFTNTNTLTTFPNSSSSPFASSFFATKRYHKNFPISNLVSSSSASSSSSQLKKSKNYLEKTLYPVPSAATHHPAIIYARLKKMDSSYLTSTLHSSDVNQSKYTTFYNGNPTPLARGGVTSTNNYFQNNQSHYRHQRNQYHHHHPHHHHPHHPHHYQPLQRVPVMI